MERKPPISFSVFSNIPKNYEEPEIKEESGLGFGWGDMFEGVKKKKPKTATSRRMQWIPEDTVRRLYVEERRSITESAKITGCSFGRFRKNLMHYGIEVVKTGRKRRK